MITHQIIKPCQAITRNLKVKKKSRADSMGENQKSLQTEFHIKLNRIESGKRDENTSPDHAKKNVKIIPKNKISHQPEKPVQLIMKVGNLFLSNVNQNLPNKEVEENEYDSKDPAKYSKTMPKLKLESERISPSPDLSKHANIKQPKTVLNKESEKDFISKVTNQASVGVYKYRTFGSKLSSTPSHLKSQTPRDSRHIGLSNSPQHRFGTKPDSASRNPDQGQP